MTSFLARRRVAVIIALSVVSAAIPNPVATMLAQETDVWPQFRGTDGSGIAVSRPLPVEFGPDKKMLWSTALPPGVSSPCVWGDRIFLTAHNTEQKDLETICLDRARGNVLWRKPAGAEEIEQVHEVSSPANATPVADDQHVYVYFASYGLLCYDREGNLQWRHALPMPQGRFGTGTSPILVGELLILNHDMMLREDGGDSYLLALDRRTGKLAWTAKHPPAFTPYTTPVHWQDSGRDVVIVFSFGRLTAYDAATGTELWSVADFPVQTVATPVLGDGRLYLCATGPFGETENAVPLPAFAEVAAKADGDKDGLINIQDIPQDVLLIDRRMSRGAGNSTVQEFVGFADADGDQKISEAEWTQFAKLGKQFLAESKQGVFAVSLPDKDRKDQAVEAGVVWTDDKNVPEIPSPLYLDGRLYTVKNGGILVCRDARTGDVLARLRLNAPGGYFSSPVYGDGKLYTASDRGLVSVIQVGDELKLLATNDLGDPIVATPAIVDGKLYIRTAQRLCAFGE